MAFANQADFFIRVAGASSDKLILGDVMIAVDKACFILNLHNTIFPAHGVDHAAVLNQMSFHMHPFILENIVKIIVNSLGPNAGLNFTDMFFPQEEHG